MRGIQRRRNLFDDSYGQSGIHRPTSEQLVQIAAVDQAHSDEKLAVNLAKIVDRHRMWLPQTGRRLRLPAEPPLKFLVARQVRWQQFQRNPPLRDCVEGSPHLSHTAATQQFD